MERKSRGGGFCSVSFWQNAVAYSRVQNKSAQNSHRKYRDGEARRIPLHPLTKNDDYDMMMLIHRSLVCISVFVGFNSCINFSLALTLTQTEGL